MEEQLVHLMQGLFPELKDAPQEFMRDGAKQFLGFKNATMLRAFSGVMLDIRVDSKSKVLEISFLADSPSGAREILETCEFSRQQARDGFKETWCYQDNVQGRIMVEAIVGRMTKAFPATESFTLDQCGKYSRMLGGTCNVATK